MAVSLTNFVKYAHINDGYDSAEVQMFLDAAVAHAESAGIKADIMANDAKYALYVYAIANYLYDNRAFSNIMDTLYTSEFIKFQMVKMRKELENECRYRELHPANV